MGHYCCCGQRTREPCQCEWEGWHNLSENKDDLPDKEGLYCVRFSEDGENHEDTSQFSIIPKIWNPTSQPSQWEKDYFDGWIGWAGVYAWKEIKESELERGKK